MELKRDSVHVGSLSLTYSHWLLGQETVFRFKSTVIMDHGHEANQLLVR